MSVDVALDLPRMRHMSVGMTAYAEELARRLPLVASDLSFEVLVRSSALDRDEQLAFPARLRRAHPRLVHHLSVYAPLLGPRPFVITVHDLIHLRFPQYFKGRVGPYYRTIVRTVCARAARVITDDERTVADLERYLRVPAAKVRVIPLGVDDVFLGDVAPYVADRPYFFYAGNRKPHKNLATMTRAWAALPDALDVDLVLTGDEGDAIPEARRERGRILFAGDLSTHELARRYRGAAALVYPSLCEGFGLPMLEAASSGGYVIASDAAVPAALSHVVETFSPFDVDRLRTLMARALERPLATPAASRAVARALTWDRCARATAEVYRDVLAERPRR